MSLSAKAIQPGLQRVPGIKNIIAVASGKGGVGKSTTTVNLALSLKNVGLKVGLLDADIHGPNQPTMLGVCKRPEESEDKKKLYPITSHGLPSMSIAYIIGPDSPMIWRGPMVSKALQQLLFDTAWPELDVLLLDCPPGTGDIQLTLAQKIPLTGAVVVTTPQEVACVDARKGVAMFNKVNIPVLGLIENMKTYHCPNCGHEDALFGEGGGQAIAEQFEIPYLASIPLDKIIGKLADVGIPIVAKDAKHPVSLCYKEAATSLLEQLNTMKSDYSQHFGQIQVEPA